MKRAGGKHRTISAAVGPWIDMATKKEDWATVTRRISLLMELDASPSALYQAYSRVCHDVIRADDRENLKELVRAGVKLSGLLVDPVQVSILTRLVVDCCFVVEEYDVALRMLAGSSSGLDAEEADIMRNKLLAHKALKDGNKQLAVALFRSFMESVRRMDEDLVDPVAWETVPKEFVLGLNAARVADILASMGDRKGAVEARGEAKGYYEIALGRLPEGSVRSGEIEKKLKRLR